MTRAADVSWDPVYYEEPDPIPPNMVVPPCRPCLGTGVMLERVPEGLKFTSGCCHCGKGFELELEPDEDG